MSLEDHATQFLSTRKDLGSVDVANTWKLLLVRTPLPTPTTVEARKALTCAVRHNRQQKRSPEE